MSLVRLLAAGKSLVGLKESGGRYHLSGRRGLPTFEAKKNPFRSGSREVVEGGADTPIPTAEGMASAGAAQATQSGERADVERSRLASGLRNRLFKLGDLFNGRSRMAGKPSGLRPANGLVQAELKLEGVKVVRNDLTDSDLEVVAAGPGAGSSSLTEVHEAPAPEVVDPVRTAWTASPTGDTATKPNDRQDSSLKAAAGGLVGRLFGPGKR